MNVFTQAVWQVIEEDELLLTELRALMRQHLQQSCLHEVQAFEVSTTLLQECILERFRKWLDGLPTLPTPLIGMRLAVEAMQYVEWRCIAEKLQEGVVS